MTPIVLMPLHGLTQLPPLSLYVHFPWCVRKCPYCDFNSHQRGSAAAPPSYIDALIHDFERELPSIGSRTIGTQPELAWKQLG